MFYRRLFVTIWSTTFYSRMSFEEFMKMSGGPKVALSGLRQFLATEGPLKIMKDAFYLMLKLF